MRDTVILIFIALGSMFIGWIFGTGENFTSSEPTETTLPDSIRLQDLNEVMKQTRIVRIKPDSCQWVMSPYLGETTGITLIHHPECDNPKHKR